MTQERPSREALERAAGRRVADLVGPGLAVLFCGINPGLYSAAVGHHFARPGNRFWKVLALSGFTDGVLEPDDERALLDLGVGITNLVERSSATAKELTRDELRAGARRVAALVEQHRPRIVAFLGMTTYRAAFDKPRAGLGEQSDRLGVARIFLLPNPSGAQARYQLGEMAKLFTAVRVAAGIEASAYDPPHDPPRLPR